MSSRAGSWLAAGLAAAAVVAIAAIGLRENAAPPAADPPPAVVTPAATLAPAAPAAAVPAPVVPVRAATREASLELPDGTFVPMLNGATGALSLKQYWGARPWSPILHVVRSDAGVDWYVHADGTFTTTEMKWRSDLGRLDAMTRIAIPKGEPPPVKPSR